MSNVTRTNPLDVTQWITMGNGSHTVVKTRYEFRLAWRLHGVTRGRGAPSPSLWKFVLYGAIIGAQVTLVLWRLLT